MLKLSKEQKGNIKDGLIIGLIGGLIIGLIIGLIYGLTITFTTQLIALLTSNPEFVMFDLVVSLVLIIVVEVIGWIIVKKLKEAKK